MKDNRPLISHKCEHCKKTFHSTAPNAMFCPAPACQKAKQLRWNLNKQEYNKSRLRVYKSMGNTVKLYNNPCQFTSDQGEVCGDLTGINRFLCPYHFENANAYVAEAL